VCRLCQICQTCQLRRKRQVDEVYGYHDSPLRCTRCAKCVTVPRVSSVLSVSRVLCVHLSGVPGVSLCQVCRVCRHCQVYGYHDSPFRCVTVPGVPSVSRAPCVSLCQMYRVCLPFRCTRCVVVPGVSSVPAVPGVRLSRLTCQVCHCAKCAECVESAMCTAIMAYLSGVPGVSWCQVCRVCRQCQVYGYHDSPARCVTVPGVPSVSRAPCVRLSWLTSQVYQVCRGVRCVECAGSARCTAITTVLWTSSRASRSCSPTSMLAPETAPLELHFLRSSTTAATGRRLHPATTTCRPGLGGTIQPDDRRSSLLHCPPCS